MDTPHISIYDTGTSGVKSVSDLENCKHLKCPTPGILFVNLVRNVNNIFRVSTCGYS